MDLFEKEQKNTHSPLAYRMRPRSLDEYIGQQHILGKGKLLRRAIQIDQISSIILYGPPGTGKTTLARVIANTTKSHFATLNAVLSGVKELRYEIEQAQQRRSLYGKKTILFIDEVHRWNKSQQDALLPWVENGTCILIGATTENPYFEVNAALVSRSRIFQLTSLTQDELHEVALQALNDPTRGYGLYSIEFEEGALEHLIEIANGDARSLLNALELAVETSTELFPPPEGESLFITLEAAEQSIQQKVVLYDKEGDYHFDVISAFIKSIRGSDVDAALYWLARMIRGGEDPRFIFRRLLISCAEDIGLADPQALVVVQANASAYDRIGLPEGRFLLAHATIYAATAPKSNSTMGFFDALKTVEQEQSSIPNHLKDPSRDQKGFGHGEGYLYPHAYKDHFVAQQYLPSHLQKRMFYYPSNQGYEKEISHHITSIREALMEVELSSEKEQLSFSDSSLRNRFITRVDEHAADYQLTLREKVFHHISLQRSDRVLVINSGHGLFVWEALRRVPEGLVIAHSSVDSHQQHLHSYSSLLDELDRPTIIYSPLKDLFSFIEKGLTCEFIISRNLYKEAHKDPQILTSLLDTLSQGGTIVCVEYLSQESSSLSDFLTDEEKKKTLSSYEDTNSYSLTDLKEFYQGFEVVDTYSYTTVRSFSEDDLKRLSLPVDVGELADQQLAWKERVALISYTKS
jgi:putative ATPase